MTADAFIKQILEYLELCRDTEVSTGKVSQRVSRPPTMEGLAAHLSIAREEMEAYLQGGFPAKYKKERQRVQRALTLVRDSILAETLEATLVGRYEQRAGLMVLKRLGYEEGGKEAGPEQVEVAWKGVSGEELAQWSK